MEPARRRPRAQESIPADVLTKVKKASVFVKVSLGPLEYSGSGFAVQSKGDTVYLVTNEHVVAKPDLEGLGTAAVRASRTRAVRAPTNAVWRFKDSEPEVSVVFNSGTKEEQVLKAEPLALDKPRDLAILKVSGRPLRSRADSPRRRFQTGGNDAGLHLWISIRRSPVEDER